MTQISRRLLLLMFIAAGLVSGLAAVLFHEWVVLSRELLFDRVLLIAARTDETVHALLGRMHATRVDRCPVVDEGGVVVGFVSPSDFVRARFHRQAEPGDETLR